MAFILPPTEDRRVSILGAGVLGRRIAAVWAAGGYAVSLRDPNEEQLKAALEYIKADSKQYPGGRGPADLNIQTFQDLAPAVENAFLVIECAPEVLPLKQETFVELEQLAPPDAILTTNSSSYKSREVASLLKPETRQRVLNMHYTMPPVQNIVELMTCGDTQAATIFPFLVEKLREVGMKPVIAHRESTGFVTNRVWAAVKRECLMVLAEGVSTPQELDAACADFFGGGAGPCLAMDVVGLDTVSLIEKHYIEERGLPESGVIPFLQGYIDEGRLGAKSKLGGFYPPEYLAKAIEQATKQQK